MKRTSKKKALTQTTEEYASRSSIHGIGYAFDRNLNSVLDDDENNAMKTMAMMMMMKVMDMMMIHGISCAFDRDLNVVDRLLWLLVVLAFLGIAAYLSWDLWSQWKNDQVIKLYSILSQIKVCDEAHKVDAMLMIVTVVHHIYDPDCDLDFSGGDNPEEHHQACH